MQGASTLGAEAPAAGAEASRGRIAPANISLTLLVCALGAGPQSQLPSSAEGLAPIEGVDLRFAPLPERLDEAMASLSHLLESAPLAGLLLVGFGNEPGDYRIKMRAENRQRPGRKEPIRPQGPAVARSAAPIQPMVQALRDAGLPARACSEPAPAGLNFALYSLLSDPPAALGLAPVGALQAPKGANGELGRAVRAAAGAFARSLSAQVQSPRG